MGNIHHIIREHGRVEAKRLVEGSERHLVDLAADVMQEESLAMGLTYAGFCQVMLPHRAIPDDAIWTRRGKMVTLKVEPGTLPRSDRRVGVPFGPYARLVLIYLQTKAIQTGSPVVELGRSMGDYMRRIGVSRGGKSYRNLKEQMNRISVCRLAFDWTSGARVGFVNSQIVQEGFLALDDDGVQGSLWVDTVTLDDRFYKALRERPVPLYEPAIKALAGRSLAMDLYVWLAYRLHSLDRDVEVSWAALFDQFGGGYDQRKHWKPEFLTSLRLALAVYEDANIVVTERGMTLSPSRPPITKATIVALPRR